MRNLLIAGSVLAAGLLWVLSQRGDTDQGGVVPKTLGSPSVESPDELENAPDVFLGRDMVITRAQSDGVLDESTPQATDEGTPIATPGTFLEITVERDGAPAPEVGVWMCDRRRWQPLDFLDVQATIPEETEFLLTDGAGVANFEGLPRARYTVGLETVHPMERPTRFVSAEYHTGYRYTVALGTATVRGSVHDADGKPRAGVGVQVSGMRPDPVHRVVIFALTITDDRGEYVVGDLAATEYDVVMAPSGKFDGRDQPERRSVTLARGETAVVDFGSPLGSPHWRGRVLNALGEAFPGTGLLTLTKVDGGESASVDIEVGGHFDFAFTPGTWTVRARVTGAPSLGFDLGEVELLAEDTRRDLIVPGARVTGVLSPPDVIADPSKPHSWTGIKFRLEGHLYPAAFRNVNVDAEGRYTIDGLEPGTWVVAIWPGKLVGGEPVKVTIHEGESRVELDLER